MSKFISNSNVYKMASNLKSYVESNGKLPYRYVFDGVEFTTQEMQDIMTYVLLNLGSNVRADTPKWCTKAQGDNIIEDIYKNDYINQAGRVHDYIIKNGQVPNYVTSVKSKKKVNIDLYTYCISKILVWYKNHGQLPNYCTYDYRALGGNPSPSKSKYGHATKSGCDNRGQNNGVYCAPHSMQEVIRNLTGKVIPQSTLASWAGTTSRGTGHSGIETAIAKAAKYLGVNLSCRWYNFSELGWDGINKIINSSNQDCIIHNLYRYNPGVYDGDGHYEVINSISGNTVKVQNSLGDRCSGGCYCGYVENRSKSTFQTYISGISQKSVCVITRS